MTKVVQERRSQSQYTEDKSDPMSTDLLQLAVLSMALFELSLNALVGKDDFWWAVILSR